MSATLKALVCLLGVAAIGVHMALAEPSVSTTQHGEICFEASVERTHETGTNSTNLTSDSSEDSTNAWVVLDLEDDEDVYSFGFTATFARTSGIMEFTNSDPRTMRVNVTYNMPGVTFSAGTGLHETAILYGDSPLDLANVSSDTRTGYSVVADDNGEYTGGAASAVFDLATTEKFAIVARQTLNPSGSLVDVRRSANIIVRQVSTADRPCR